MGAIKKKKDVKSEKQPSAEKKTNGTIISEEERSRANRLSDTEREALFKRGMALIYGGANSEKTTADRH